MVFRKNYWQTNCRKNSSLSNDEHQLEKRHEKYTWGKPRKKNNICWLQEFLQNAISHQLLYNNPFKIGLLNQ